MNNRLGAIRTYRKGVVKLLRQKLRRKNIFALFEMILSLAILTVLASFSVRMFISAKNNNAKTFDLYKGLSCAINVIEGIKGASSLQAVMAADFAGTIFSANGETLALNTYYDHDWTPILSDPAKEEPIYAVKAQIEPLKGPDKGENNPHCIYSIEVRVLRLVPYVLEKHKENEIVFLETLKWFPPTGIKEGKRE